MTNRIITYERLISYLKQRVSVNEFLNGSNDLSPLINIDSQCRILEQVNLLIDQNPYYFKLFLKGYMKLIESSNGEIIEEIYEVYCSDNVLNSVELSPTDSDIASYSINGFSSDEEENSNVIIKETPKLISGNNTTGLRTWEAALYLSNYLNSNKYDFKDQSILELGAGTGLVGLSLIKYYNFKFNRIKQIAFTDGSSELIDNLNDTFKLNGIYQGHKDIPIIKAQQLLWGTSNKSSENYIQDAPKGIDYLIGADITYDSRVLALLCDTINEFFLVGTKKAIISATVRNEITIKDWETELNKWFGNNWCIIDHCPNAHQIDCNCWFKSGTPEIRIYEIRDKHIE